MSKLELIAGILAKKYVKSTNCWYNDEYDISEELEAAYTKGYMDAMHSLGRS